MSTNDIPPTPRPHAVFHWGDGRFALDVEGLQEVVADLALTPLPRAGEGWLGVGNLRGEILPAVSLQRWFPGGAATATPPVFLVLRTPAGKLALAADGVAGVRSVPPEPDGEAGSAVGDPGFVVRRWQPPGEEAPVHCLDATRLARKLRDEFVSSNLPPF